MKTAILFASLALAPALLMADPEPSSAPSQVMTNAPAGSEDLAEHAALVQRLGAEAARGFDAETHAHDLRLQIEALVSAPAGQGSTSLKVPLPAQVAPPPAGERRVPSPDQPRSPALPTAANPSPRAVEQAIQRVRLAIDDLEAKMQALALSDKRTADR